MGCFNARISPSESWRPPSMSIIPTQLEGRIKRFDLLRSNLFFLLFSPGGWKKFNLLQAKAII
jgi:hypothetical protein